MFEDSADYERIAQGDALELCGIRDAIENGGEIYLTNGAIRIKLEAKLTPRQRAIILAGGLLNYTRDKING